MSHTPPSYRCPLAWVGMAEWLQGGRVGSSQVANLAEQGRIRAQTSGYPPGWGGRGLIGRQSGWGSDWLLVGVARAPWGVREEMTLYHCALCVGKLQTSREGRAGGLPCSFPLPPCPGHSCPVRAPGVQGWCPALVPWAQGQHCAGPEVWPLAVDVGTSCQIQPWLGRKSPPHSR